MAMLLLHPHKNLFVKLLQGLDIKDILRLHINQIVSFKVERQNRKNLNKKKETTSIYDEMECH